MLSLAAEVAGRFVGVDPAWVSAAECESYTSLALPAEKSGYSLCTQKMCKEIFLRIFSRQSERKSKMAKTTSITTKAMTGEELGQKLLNSVREMKADMAARTNKVSPNEVAAARMKTGLSQAQFAQALHISARTLQEWEQGRRHPSGAAQALIQIAFRHPEVISECLA
jgi:putative transcriptional regulator